MRRLLRSITKNPWVNLAVGVALFGTGASEALDGLEQGFHLGAHHGVMLAGLLEIFDALEKLLEALEPD